MQLIMGGQRCFAFRGHKPKKVGNRCFKVTSSFTANILKGLWPHFFQSVDMTLKYNSSGVLHPSRLDRGKR